MAVVTRFESQVEKALAENVKAMFALEIGDVYRHAYVKGFHAGLNRALTLHREVYRVDDDRDSF